MVLLGKTINFQVDNGASVNILPKRYLQGTAYSAPESPKTLLMWNKSTLQAKGVCRVKLLNPNVGRKYAVEFIIVSNALTPLLVSKACQQMKLVTINGENFHTAQVHRVSTNCAEPGKPPKYGMQRYLIRSWVNSLVRYTCKPEMTSHPSFCPLDDCLTR